MNFKLLFIISLLCFGLIKPLNAQIVLNKVSDMSFGTIGFDFSHRGDILLGTDGSVTLSGTSGIAHEGGSNAGSVIVTGNSQDVIEIKCRARGRMMGPNNRILNLTDIEISINSGTVAGSANPCQDIRQKSKPAIVHDLAVDPKPTILIGARARIGDNKLSSDTYSTSKVGSAIGLRVIFQ